MPLCPDVSFCCSVAGTYFCSIYLMWVSLSFLDSWCDVFYHVWRILSHYCFTYFICLIFYFFFSAKPNYICVKLPDIIPQLLDFSLLFLSLFYFSLCALVLVISAKLSANVLTLLNYVKSINEHTEIFFFSEPVLWVLFLALPRGSFLYFPPLCWTSHLLIHIIYLFCWIF